MISRQYAKQLLDKYIYNEFDINACVFSADWTITKEAKKRALISPLLFLEEGNSGGDDGPHTPFHRRCKFAHYNDNFI
jgi:hypothetical protein